MSTPQTYPTKPRTRLEPRGTIVLFVFINRVPVSLWSSEKRTERERKKRKDSFFIFVLSTHRSLCNPWLQRELFRLTWNTEKRGKNSLMERILLSSFERIHPLTITEIFISSRNELWKCDNNCSRNKAKGRCIPLGRFPRIVLATLLRRAVEGRGGGKGEGGSNFGGVGTKRERVSSSWSSSYVGVSRASGTTLRIVFEAQRSATTCAKRAAARGGSTLRCPRRSAYDESSRVESRRVDTRRRRNTLEKIDPFRATDRKLTLLHGVRVD